MIVLAGVFFLTSFDLWTKEDFVFSVRQELFAQQFSKNPPEPLYMLLGDSNYSYRELVEAELTKTSFSNPRWLFWYKRINDPEIRMRMIRILVSVISCVRCGGRAYLERHSMYCAYCRYTGNRFKISDVSSLFGE